MRRCLLVGPQEGPGFPVLPCSDVVGFNRRDGLPAVFYIHPWEVDPGQPRANGVSAKSRFRHYTNLAKTGDRLGRLTRDFRWGRMDSIFLDGTSERAPNQARNAAA